MTAFILYEMTVWLAPKRPKSKTELISVYLNEPPDAFLPTTRAHL